MLKILHNHFHFWSFLGNKQSAGNWPGGAQSKKGQDLGRVSYGIFSSIITYGLQTVHLLTVFPPYLICYLTHLTIFPLCLYLLLNLPACWGGDGTLLVVKDISSLRSINGSAAPCAPLSTCLLFCLALLCFYRLVLACVSRETGFTDWSTKVFMGCFGFDVAGWWDQRIEVTHSDSS